jgi:DNA-binding MarR family transcriptional regulator
LINRAASLAEALAAAARMNRPPPRPPTKPQAQVLAQIERFIEQRGYGPTLREIADEMKLARTTVKLHVDALFKKGVLEADRQDGRVIARTMRPAP